MKAVSVKPGKYAPMGNKIAPAKSAIAPVSPAATGPKSIAATTTGINANPIFIFHIDMERNLESTISIATKHAIITVR